MAQLRAFAALREDPFDSQNPYMALHNHLELQLEAT